MTVSDAITTKVSTCIADLQRVALELRKQVGGTEEALGQDLRLSVYVSIIERAVTMMRAQDELRLTLEQINANVDASIRKSIEKMRMT